MTWFSSRYFAQTEYMFPAFASDDLPSCLIIWYYISMYHTCLSCSQLSTIRAGAQTPAGLGLFQAHWTHRTADYMPWLRLTTRTSRRAYGSLTLLFLPTISTLYH